MKHLLVTFIMCLLFSCSQGKTQKLTENGYTYETVKDDPLKTRIYTLKNGLKVYLSVNKNEPRVQTYIAVRTGSKNDPAETTGLAHYLEHMLFKGTDKIGSLDYEKEAPLIKEITDLYEERFHTKDEQKRLRLYEKIDSVSGVAAKYAIANEYDRLLSLIGAKGTNAYTWLDQTVYVNDIPANQVDKWLKIEAERFKKPVFRLFHTEMEAVYEEKNRTLDSDMRKQFYALYENLFRKHPYGTQSTIGKVEHLKNPSLVNIQEYFDTYYVPNNMAVCLSGDFDPSEMIKKIDDAFSSYVYKELPKQTKIMEDVITSPIKKEIFGPDAESVLIGFRFNGATSKEADYISLIDMILSNSSAGLIDLNLNQKQKVIGARSYPYFFDEYSVHHLSAKPRKGQSLEDVQELLLSQIELIKKGEFPDWLLPAIINDLKLNRIKTFESNRGRADAFVNSFIVGETWENNVTQIERLSKITKQEIVEFAKAHFNSNYVAIYKRTGEDKSIVKIEKPKITPVDVNRTAKSEFSKAVEAIPTTEIKPVFLDYEKDIQKFSLNSSIPVLYTKNNENDLFSLYYSFDMGTLHINKLNLAISYLNYLGTDKYTPSEIKQEFYKIGCSFNVFNSEKSTWVSLTGLKENMEAGVRLFEHLLANAKANDEALQNLKKDIFKARQDTKLNKRAILFSALRAYGEYGSKSPYKHNMSEEDINTTGSEELLEIIHGLTSYKHKVLYYGPSSEEELASTLNTLHIVPNSLKDLPKETTYSRAPIAKNKIYYVNYDMQQAEAILLAKKETYNPAKVPIATLFNEYFGGGMGSIVFQTMRESKALAYSVWAGYTSAREADDPNYMFSYIGTQADKVPEAMNGMFELLNTFPRAEIAFDAAKKAIMQKIQTERILKTNILFNYERAKKLNLTYDIRKDIYTQLPKFTLDDIATFHKSEVANDTHVILLIGDKKKLNFKSLKKYGKVKELSLEEIFGY